MEKFTKKVALGKKNHKNTKKNFSNCLTKLREPLKGLDFHLLSWDARRGAPGRRQAHDRRGAVCFCFLMGVSLCETRLENFWHQNYRALPRVNQSYISIKPRVHGLKRYLYLKALLAVF